MAEDYFRVLIADFAARHFDTRSGQVGHLVLTSPLPTGFPLMTR